MNNLILPDTAKFYQEYLYESNGQLEFVESLPIPSNVIISIGKNNTRKSRFLRNLLTEENHLLASDTIISILKSIEKYINKLINEIDGNYLSYNIVQSTSFTSSKFDLSDIKNFIDYSRENKIITIHPTSMPNMANSGRSTTLRHSKSLTANYLGELMR